MRRHDECVLAFGKPHGKLPAETVRFFRCDLPGFEGLADLVGDHVIRPAAASHLEVQAFLQYKFLIYRDGITAIGRDQFAFFGLLRILGIVRSVTEALCNRMSFCRMKRYQSCSCHDGSSIKTGALPPVRIRPSICLSYSIVRHKVPTLELLLIRLSFTCSILQVSASSICCFSSRSIPSILTESSGWSAQK